MTNTTRKDIDRADDKARNIETTFTLDNTRADGPDGPQYVFLSLNTSHNKTRKQYRTTVSRVYRDGYVNRWMLSLDLYKDTQPVSDTATPIARHSAKALREAHTSALNTYLQIDNFTALLDWTSRADTRA
jgi:hypothetical protein